MSRAPATAGRLTTAGSGSRIAMFLSRLDFATAPPHRTVLAAVLHYLARAQPHDQRRWAAYVCRVLDPETAPSRPAILLAALHQLTSGEPAGQLGWAGYAHRELRALHGPVHPATLHAAAAYAAILCSHGHTGKAVDLCRGRLDGLTRLDDRALLLDGHRQLADTLHADRQCAPAYQEIAHALRLWHTSRGNLDAGQAILASFTAILAGCGHTGGAVALLRHHPDLVPRDDASRTRTAELIVAAELHHPPRCTARHSQPPPTISGVPGRVDAWQQALHAATHRPLPITTALCSHSHFQDQP